MYKWLLPFFCSFSALFAADVPDAISDEANGDVVTRKEEIEEPWFTGPLLTPSGHVVPPGFVNFEPYFFTTLINGIYDKNWHVDSIPRLYNVNISAPLQIGITDWMDFQITPQANYDSVQKVGSLRAGDISTQVDFQLLMDTQDNHAPGIKFYVGELFPTGKYQNLNPEKLGTDIGGGGSFITSTGFVFTRLFHITGRCFLRLRLNPFYSYAAPVHVRGFNAYGGARDTRGRVYPGQRYGALFGMELSLTRNWVFALDATWRHINKTRFSGKKGINVFGMPALIGFPSSEQFTLAPALEYNFNSSVGLIAGPWFTIGGRNTARFISAVIALNFFGPVPDFSVPKHHSRGGGGASL